MQTLAKTRNIRIDDDTWDKAGLVAEQLGTSRNQIIVEYIRSLKPWTTAKWGAKGPSGSRSRGRGVTKARAIRVSDEDWAAGHEAAAMNDTSLSYLIFLHLKSLKRGPAVGVRRPGTGAPKGSRKDDPPDPATCPHKRTRTIPYGTFCTRCGIKIEDLLAACEHEKVTTNRFGTFCRNCKQKVERAS